MDSCDSTAQKDRATGGKGPATKLKHRTYALSQSLSHASHQSRSWSSIPGHDPPSPVMILHPRSWSFILGHDPPSSVMILHPQSPFSTSSVAGPFSPVALSFWAVELQLSWTSLYHLVNTQWHVLYCIHGSIYCMYIHMHMPQTMQLFEWVGTIVFVLWMLSFPCCKISM